MIRKLVLSMFLSGAVGMPFVGSALADEPTVASPENGIAAQGEGMKITVADVLQHMSKTLGDNVVAQLKAKSPKDFAFAFTLYRDQLVALALLKNAALKKSDELMKLPEVKEAVTKMKEQILTTTYFAQDAKKRVTDAVIEKLFAEAPQEVVGISQIVLADQATAEAVIKALKSGHAFADLAKTKSTETTSGKNSGYVGSSLLSQLDSKIRDALKDLKVGAFTETPISHMGQWYVFRLDKKEKATLKEARPALESLAMARASQALLLEEKEKAKVRFYTLEGKETTEVTPIFTAPKSDKEASAPVAPAAAG